MTLCLSDISVPSSSLISDRPESSRAAVAPCPESSPEFRVKQRYALQGGAKYLLPDNKSLKGCCAWLQQAGEGVPLYSYPELKKARFGNVQTCASVWCCPICSAKISERRRSWELVPALAAAKEKGWSVCMVTYTVPHTEKDFLSALLLAMRECRKRSRSGKRMARLRAKYGLMGSIRSFEVTHGANGWHPHYHELFFTSAPVDRAALVDDLMHQWQDGARLAGLRAPNEHGVRVSTAHADIEEYVTKFGRDPKWGLAEEMSKQQVKKARGKGRAPFQLLSDFTFGADLHAGMLFADYAKCMKGERQLVWSRGLKAELGVKEMTDAQIEAIEEQDKHRITLDTLDDPEWALIRADDMVGDLWNLVAAGNKSALDDFLAPYRSTCANRRVTVAEAVGLVDWSADERDRRVSVAEEPDPFLADPLCRRLLSAGVKPQLVRGTALRLRELQSDPFDPSLPEAVQPVVFGLMADDRRERCRAASAVQPWRVVKHGRKAWEIEPNPEYRNADLPGGHVLQNELEL